MDNAELRRRIQHLLDAPHTPDEIEKFQQWVTDQVDDAYLMGQMETGDGQQNTQCPTPGCDCRVYLNVSYRMSAGDFGPHPGSDADWSVMCAAGHVVDFGGIGTDGRGLDKGREALRGCLQQ